MSCRYCGREDHNARNCPEVPRKVSRPLRGKGSYRLDEAKARIAELEEALRPLTYSAAHNTCSGPGCIVCRARELLEGS